MPVLRMTCNSFAWPGHAQTTAGAAKLLHCTVPEIDPSLYLSVGGISVLGSLFMCLVTWSFAVPATFAGWLLLIGTGAGNAASKRESTPAWRQCATMLPAADPLSSTTVQQRPAAAMVWASSALLGEQASVCLLRSALQPQVEL